MERVLKNLRPNFVKVDKIPEKSGPLYAICGEGNYDYFEIITTILNQYPFKNTKVYYKVIQDGDVDFYYFAEKN
jgi:hypothetical protein